MKHRTVITVCLIIIAAAIIYGCTGCAFRHAVLGQGADLATSAYGMDNGCSETGISGNSLLTLAAIKAGLLAVTWLIGDEDVNAIVATAGYTAAAWNLTQIERAVR